MLNSSPSARYFQKTLRLQAAIIMYLGLLKELCKELSNPYKLLEFLVLLRRRHTQGSPCLTSWPSNDIGANLNQTNSIALLAIPEVYKGNEEVVGDLLDDLAITLAKLLVELHGHVGHKIEHSRGVGVDADSEIGLGKNFGGRNAANIGQAVADTLDDLVQRLHVALAIFESHQVGASVGQRLGRFSSKNSVGTVVVNNVE